MSNSTSTTRWTPRSTVAAIIERRGRFLLVEEMINGRPVLNQPAGHLEENESLADAMRREVLEETGYHAEPLALLGLYVYRTPDRTLTFHRICFIAKAINLVENAVLDTGIIRALWLTRDEIASADNLRSPYVIECVDDYLSGRQFPLDFIQE